MNRKEKLEIILWNARGYIGKKEEVDEYIKNTDITIITESKVKDHENIKVKGFNIVGIDSRGNSGGILIFCKEDIKIEVIEEWKDLDEDFDICGIRIKHGSTNMNIIGVYRRPNKSVNPGEWTKITNFNRKGMDTLIMGDFNAKNILWNCNNTEPNGEGLQEKFFNAGFLCVNTDTMSRLNDINQSPSNLDLIFSEANVIDKIDYIQAKDAWGSDHFPIKINIEIEEIPYIKKTNRIANKKNELGRI